MKVLAILLSVSILASSPMAFADGVVNLVCTNADGKSRAISLYQADLDFLIYGGRSARLNKGSISIFKSPRAKRILLQDNKAGTIESAIFECVRAR